MNISKFVIVVGASANGMNALSEFVRQLKTGMNAAIFTVSMVSHSSKRKFTGIKIEWLYKLDEAGIVTPLKRLTGKINLID